MAPVIPCPLRILLSKAGLAAMARRVTTMVVLIAASGCGHALNTVPPGLPISGLCGGKSSHRARGLSTSEGGLRRIGSFVTNTRRVEDALLQLMDDPHLGKFMRSMRDDPAVVYFIWDTDALRRNGGGKVDHCNEGRFDIWVNLEYHRSQEGQKCTNPAGSGNLRSLLAHELGHAWGWLKHGVGSNCDNNAKDNMIAVEWESTQLTGGARRLLHVPEGCSCAGY